jgi:multiple sugar transport system permease protein
MQIAQERPADVGQSKGHKGRNPMTATARREALHGYLFILPWILGFLLFTIGPMVAGIYLSFTEYTILAPPRWIGLANYTRAIRDPLLGQSIYNTVYYVALAVPLTLVIGLLLALLLNQKVRAMPFFRTVFYIPSIVPAVASVALWVWIFNGRWGLLNQLLASIGLNGPGWLTDPAWTKISLVIWTIWGVGGTMIIYLAGLQGIPEVFYEAAEIDGASTFRRFWHITLPILSPTIFFNMILSIIGSFQIFTAVLILGGTQTLSYQTPAGGPLNSLLVYVLYIYQNAFYFFKMGYAAALAWILFLIVLVLTLIQFRMAGRWVYYEFDSAP